MKAVTLLRAMSSDTYARIAGEKTIHLVSGDLKASVEKTAKDFRSKRLLKYLPDEAVQVQLEHEGKAYDLTKSASGEWVFNAPFRGSRMRALFFLQRWRFSGILRFTVTVWFL